jgi:hypothetical protein
MLIGSGVLFFRSYVAPEILKGQNYGEVRRSLSKDAAELFAEAALYPVGRHLEHRRHHVHPARRVPALL